MTATMELGTLTTELVSVLATQTGLAVGDAVSPISGSPAPLGAAWRTLSFCWA